uniref:Ig-like domain-containing protein n=1 Tax=Timema poppense TaxID=170557 RepID=A0A7R9DGZ5_TIMPO|nr:unnamed protein product [Timema poppensis]
MAVQVKKLDSVYLCKMTVQLKKLDCVSVQDGGVRLAGPRGRAGRPGTNGTPGIPGISAYTVTLNGTASNELLIPPSIAAFSPLLPPRPIVVHEGENVRLRCAAMGTPRPTVEWRKMDGSVIPMGSWQTVSISGHTLNITRINRAHMGHYLCMANNGIPPPANQTFLLEVHFPPLIRIHNQLVGAVNGSTATLECEVEAYPESVCYWERSDGQLLERGNKYSMRDEDKSKYKVHIQLNISNFENADIGQYHCIAKNDMGITKGIFTLFGEIIYVCVINRSTATATKCLGSEAIEYYSIIGVGRTL